MGLPIAFRVAQVFGFIMTTLTNSLMLYLLVYRTPHRIGQYLNLMKFFKYYCIFYGLIEILTQPVIHPTDFGVILYCDSFLKNYRTLGTYLTVIYCGAFGLCIILLTSLFMYKFIVIVRPEKLELIKGKRLVILFIPSIIVGFVWTVGLKLSASPSSQLDEMFEKDIKIYYVDDVTRLGYVAASLYIIDDYGNYNSNYPIYIISFIMSFTMVSAIFIILYCGFRTYFKLDKTSIMSERTKKLHKQLLLTLIIKAAIPFITMFVPVFTLLVLTTCSIHVGIYANFVPLFAAIYPSLAPLVTLLMVSDFRNVFLKRGSLSKIQAGSAIDKNADRF